MKNLATGPDIAVKKTKSKAAVITLPIAEPEEDSGLPEKVVSEHAALSHKIAALESELKVLTEYIKDKGFKFLAGFNVDATKRGQPTVSSVRFYDAPAAVDAKPSDTDPAAVPTIPAVTVSILNKYVKFDQAAVERTLGGLTRTDGKAVDPNAYLEWAVDAEFDAKVLLNARGVFDAERYRLFADAIQQVATELGVDNPLKLSKALAVRETFHENRWRDFGLKSNQMLQQVLPCTVQAKVGTYEVA